MNYLRIKIDEVYLPFLLVATGTILGYNLFRWALDLKLGIVPLKNDLLNFWIPFALSWVSVLFWLRRRVHLLKVAGKRGNGYFGYQFAMVGAIALPLMISQHYLEKASFDLVRVESIEKIKQFPREKYFAVESFKVNRGSCLSYVVERASARDDDRSSFILYFACPFENDHSVWYGVEYGKSLDDVSQERKDAEYRKFLAESQAKFDDYDFRQGNYFEKAGHSDDRDGFIEAIKAKSPDLIEKEQIILISKADNFEERLGGFFPWMLGSFIICALVILAMVSVPDLDQIEFENFKKKKPLPEDDLKAMFEFLDPRGGHRAIAVLILLNILVFVIMIISGLSVVSPLAGELLEIGGNRRFEVMHGEYWRLLTSVFIHSGLMHLFMNLVGLAIAGMMLENIIGPARLTIGYLVSGILASLASIYWHENTVSVGASGAIFGLYGVILALTVFKVYPSEARALGWTLLALYAGGSLFLGLFGKVDNAAHIGGLVGGFLIGVVLVLANREQLKKKAS